MQEKLRCVGGEYGALHLKLSFQCIQKLTLLLFAEPDRKLMAQSSQNQRTTMSPKQSTHDVIPQEMHFEEPGLSTYSATTRAAVVEATG